MNRIFSWLPSSLALLTLWSIPAFAAVQTDKPKSPDAPVAAAQAPKEDFAKKLEDIERRVAAARRVFEEKVKAAKTEEERDALWTLPRPEKPFVPEYKALALAAKGTEIAAKALVQIVMVSAEDDVEGAKAALQTLLDQHVASPELALIVMLVEQILDEEAAPKAIERIRSGNTTKPVQASLIYLKISQIESEKGEDAAELRPLFERLAKEFKDLGTPWGDGTFGDIADGWLFVRDHLAIGKPAPDFETTDENGVKWKLSDYKGKVVVLDFWGAW